MTFPIDTVKNNIFFNWDKISHYELTGRYKKWKIEKWFEAELFKFMRRENYICYHVADVWYSYKFLDCHLICPQWILWWLELKKIQLDTFNISQFEESQVVLMMELDKRNPNICRVGIYSVKNNEYVILPFSEIRGNKNEKWWIKLFWKNKYEKKL